MGTSAVWTQKNLVFSLIALIIILLGIYQLIHKSNIPFALSYNDNSDLIISALPEATQVPLKLNDIIKEVEDHPVQSLEEVELILDQIQIGEPVKLKIQRSDLTLSLSLITVPYNDTIYMLIVSFVGGLFYLIALFVLIKRPKSEISATFYYAFICVAIQICSSFGNLTVPNWYLGIFNRSAYLVFTGMIPILFVHFSYVFPRQKWPNFRKLVLPLYMVTLIVISVLVFLFSVSVHPANWYKALQFTSFYNFSRLFYAVLILFAIANIVHSYFSSTFEPDRRKIRWVVLALVVGPLNFVVTWQIPLSLGYVNLIPEAYMLLIISIVPIMFAISIVKYHLLDIDVIFKRSTVYIILFFLIAMTYAIGIAITILFLGELTLQSSYLAVIIAAVAIVLFLEPAKRGVQSFVDRKFFRVQYDYRIALLNLSDAISKCHNRNALGEVLLDSLGNLLYPELIGLYEYIDIRAKPVTVFEHNISIKDFQTKLETVSAKMIGKEMNLFCSRGQLEPGINYVECDPGILPQEVSHAIAIRNQDKSLGGFLLLGNKKSGDIYTREDVDLLLNVSTQVGIALDRFRIMEDLFAKEIVNKNLARLNKMKSLFVSGVSHDLKTPISSIRMFAEILDKNDISEETKTEYLDIIQGESDRLTRMISNILDYALIERNERHYDFSQANMVDLVEKSLKIMHYPLVQQAFKIEKSFDLENEMLICDEDAIQQILINLMTNAVKFSHKEKYLGVHLFEEKKFLVIEIVDKGIGIKKTDRKKIFENYFRSKEAVEKGVGGVGLGLAIVTDIVSAHKGKIEVDSEVGSGSRFKIYLPKGNLS